MALRFNETDSEIVVFFDENVPRDALADEGVGIEFAQLCRRAAREKKVLIVDFSGVRFLSSGMVALLVRALKLTPEDNLNLRLTNLDEQARQVFRMTRLDTLFSIDDASDTATGKG
jgi:anti-anti-sigma factor